MTNGHHHPHRDHDRGHRSLRLAATQTNPTHRLGRRKFLTELGRGTFAIAVIGGVAACSSGDEPDGAVSGEGAEGGSGESTSATDPSADRLRWAQADLGFVSAYVLVRGNEAAVVDTGQSGSVDQIGDALATLSATYDQVRHVVLTHSHPDHVGSLPGVLEVAEAARPYAGADDIANITSPVDVVAVGDGDDVFGLQVIHTPGHTPGSISLLDPGIGLLVAGDALTGNADGTTVLGPNEQFTPDMGRAMTSVSRLARLEFDQVAMGHGQPVRSGAGDLVRELVTDD